MLFRIKAVDELIPSLQSALSGKIVIDATNPFALSPEGRIASSLAPGLTAGSRMASLLPESVIVRAFSHVMDELLVSRGTTQSGFWTMAIAGDDPASKQVASKLGLSAFLAAGAKPLVFTPGTGNLHAADFFACALSAVNRLGLRAIFLTGERTQVPAHLPESVLWQPYVPLPTLLPHAAALVHHGGIGTTAAALRCGTPQLIAPFAWDQFDNGARIASLGAGLVMPAKRLRPRQLARSLQTLCHSETIRVQCARLASRCTPAHDPIALCREIEHHVQAACDGARHAHPTNHRPAALTPAR